MRRAGIVLTWVLALTLGGVARADEDVQRAYRASYAHETKGEYGKALADIDRMPKAARATYVYHLRRGWLLYLLGRSWDSIAEYRHAIDARPDAIEPRLGLMLPQAALRLWLDVVATGKWVLTEDPHNRVARTRVAWAHYNLGKFAEAERHYRAVLRDYPSDVEMRAGLGWSLLKQGKNRAARRELLAALEIAPDYEAAKAGLAALDAE